jgi:glutathione S-transferase
MTDASRQTKIEEEPMIVYGSSLSPYVRKVLVYDEKGLTLEHRPIGVGSQDPGFLEASPFRKIPGFRDGDFAISDSSAIIHYLEAKYPEPALIPAGPGPRARAIWFEEFSDTMVTACGGAMFFNRLVSPRFLGRPGDLEAADKAEKEQLPGLLDYLEKVVPDEAGYLVGDTLTLADIAVASPFATLAHIDVGIAQDRHPRTRDYVERILARPSFALWIERERDFLTRAA